MSDTPKRKTDEEIRERITYFQASIEDEEAHGLAGGEDWMEAVTASRWLKWVLGE